MLENWWIIFVSYFTLFKISLYFDEFDLQTIIYRAPEVMFGLSFGPEIDMWSLGCVLAEVFSTTPEPRQLKLRPGEAENSSIKWVIRVSGVLLYFSLFSISAITTRAVFQWIYMHACSMTCAGLPHNKISFWYEIAYQFHDGPATRFRSGMR